MTGGCVNLNAKIELFSAIRDLRKRAAAEGHDNSRECAHSRLLQL